jgi:predicted aconitase with swiveling domain
MYKCRGEWKMEINARKISKGIAEGEALISKEPISFYGGVDPDTGIIVEKGHPLEGKNVKDKILVFPFGKGSTVGSYILYRMKKKGVAPKAIINKECDPIVAVGAIISEIPLVDKPEIDIFTVIKDGDVIAVNANEGKIIVRK